MLSRRKQDEKIDKLIPTIKLSATKKTLKKKKSYTLKISKLAKGDAVKSVKSSKKAVANGEITISIVYIQDPKLQIYQKQGNSRIAEEFRHKLAPHLVSYTSCILGYFGGINYFLRHPEEKVVEGKRHRRNADVSAANPESRVPDRHHITVNNIRFITKDNKAAKVLRSRKIHRMTESWLVRGHYRRYKSGKVVFIRSYEKGTGKRSGSTYMPDLTAPHG